MKRVLIISYYWPPSGGGGVHRWLKMTKYIPDLNWQPVIFTPANGEAPVIDESLLNQVHPSVEVVTSPIWEPYSFYKKFTGKKSDEKVYSGFINDKKESFTQKLSVFIRGNFFIPDARKFWINSGAKVLSKYLKNNPVDAIISTGPPHSTHLIASKVVKDHNIPWIADFRDPWTNIDFYDQLKLTPWADKKHRRLEQLVLKSASKIVTVSSHWADDFKQLSDRDVTVIRNGFDHADFENSGITLDATFSICHVGSMNKDRNPNALWEVLASKVKDPDFAKNLSIKLIGQVDHFIFEQIKKFELEPWLTHIPFLPHSEVISHLQQSQVLLLPINDTPNSLGVVPGKLYEYMGAQRPILGIGPLNGDSAEILRDSAAGEMIGYEDISGVNDLISKYFKSYKENNLHVSANDIQKYSRKSMAELYVKTIESLL